MKEIKTSEKTRTGKKAQQEIVGFVLIVVLVMVALMVFLVIAARKPQETQENSHAGNLLSALMKHTTECAIVYEPDYDDVGDLIKSCWENKRCSNLNKMACDYLNETLNGLMEKATASEGSISGYELSIFHEISDSGAEMTGIFETRRRGCVRGSFGAQKIISASIGRIVARLTICS